MSTTRRLVAPGMFSAALLAACGGVSAPATTPIAAASYPGPLAGEPLRSQAGARACGEACLDAQRAACATDGRTWHLTFTGKASAFMDEIHVSSAGLARLVSDAASFYGVDGRVWLACLPECGDGGGTCFPWGSDWTYLDFHGLGECDVTTTPAEPWNGHPSVIAHLACAGSTLDVRAVPDLVEARDALMTAGMIARFDPATEIDGLVVAVVFGGNEQPIVDSVEVEDCAALEIPDGYEVHASMAEFESVEGVHKEVWTAFRERHPDRKLDASVLLELQTEACTRYVDAATP